MGPRDLPTRGLRLVRQARSPDSDQEPGDVEIGSVLTTIAFFHQLVSRTGNPLFTGQVTFWLWFTVIFANFAEAMAEGRGKAQADALLTLVPGQGFPPHVWSVAYY